MLRTYVMTLGFLFALGLSSTGQETPTKSAQTPERKVHERKPGDLITLRVAPRAEPRPAFRYRLLPTIDELQHGNAVPGYLRMMTSATMAKHLSDDQRAKMLDVLALPAEEFKKQDQWKEWLLTSPVWAHFDESARRSYVDWQIEGSLRRDAIGALLPDIQDFRPLSRLIALRIRYQMAAGDWPGVFISFKTGFAMARHVSNCPCLISALTGTAQTFELLERVQELQQNPDAPNVYWALSDLPDPLLDYRLAWQGEGWFIELILPGMVNLSQPAKTRVLSADEINRVHQSFQETLKVGVQNGDFKLKEGFDLNRAAAQAASEAKKSLEAFGVPAQTVAAMTGLQRYFAYSIVEHRKLYDDARKWTYLPYAELHKRLGDQITRLNQVKEKDELGLLVSSLMMPAIQKVVDTEFRVKQRIAAMRVIEALRLHAAQTGKWPGTLEEITQVPIPIDPFSNRPFRYEFKGDQATLKSHESPEVLRINYLLMLGEK